MTKECPLTSDQVTSTRPIQEIWRSPEVMDESPSNIKRLWKFLSQKYLNECRRVIMHLPQVLWRNLYGAQQPNPMLLQLQQRGSRPETLVNTMQIGSIKPQSKWKQEETIFSVFLQNLSLNWVRFCNWLPTKNRQLKPKDNSSRH